MNATYAHDATQLSLAFPTPEQGDLFEEEVCSTSSSTSNSAESLRRYADGYWGPESSSIGDSAWGAMMAHR